MNSEPIKKVILQDVDFNNYVVTDVVLSDYTTMQTLNETSSLLSSTVDEKFQLKGNYVTDAQLSNFLNDEPAIKLEDISKIREAVTIIAKRFGWTDITY